MIKDRVSCLKNFEINYLLVDLWFSDSSRKHVYLPLDECFPKKLCLFAKSQGALFVVCGAKYGCRQFCSDAV